MLTTFHTELRVFPQTDLPLRRPSQGWRLCPPSKRGRPPGAVLVPPFTSPRSLVPNAPSLLPPTFSACPRSCAHSSVLPCRHHAVSSFSSVCPLLSRLSPRDPRGSFYMQDWSSHSKSRLRSWVVWPCPPHWFCLQRSLLAIHVGLLSLPQTRPVQWV